MKNYTKVSLDNDCVFGKKNQVSRNNHVSFYNEQFHCGGLVTYTSNAMEFLMDAKPEMNRFGIGKKEHRVGQTHRVDGYRGSVNQSI